MNKKNFKWVASLTLLSTIGLTSVTGCKCNLFKEETSEYTQAEMLKTFNDALKAVNNAKQGSMVMTIMGGEVGQYRVSESYYNEHFSYAKEYNNYDDEDAYVYTDIDYNYMYMKTHPNGIPTNSKVKCSTSVDACKESIKEGKKRWNLSFLLSHSYSIDEINSSIGVFLQYLTDGSIDYTANDVYKDVSTTFIDLGNDKFKMEAKLKDTQNNEHALTITFDENFVNECKFTSHYEGEEVEVIKIVYSQDIPSAALPSDSEITAWRAMEETQG